MIAAAPITTAAPAMRPASMRPVVRPHPRGGWTHAVPAGSSAARIYAGNWPTRRAALRALPA